MTIKEAKKIVKSHLEDRDFEVSFEKCDSYSMKDTDLSWWDKEPRDAVAYLLKNRIKPSVTFLPTSKKSSGYKDLERSIDRLAEASEVFGDAILDEQASKIKDLEAKLEKSDSDYMDKVHLAVERGREISRLNDIIHKKNVMIQNLVSERGKIARELTAEKAVHQVDLQATKSAESALLYHEREYEKSLKEKDEVIDDLSRELARSKEREEELLATIKDYLKEIERLKGGKKAKRKNAQAPKISKVIFYSSASPKNNFLDELRKQFFKG